MAISWDPFKVFQNLFKTFQNLFKTFQNLFKTFQNFFKTFLNLFKESRPHRLTSCGANRALYPKGRPVQSETY